MAVFALTNVYVEINSTSSVNDHVKSAQLSIDVADLDSTAMGDTWKESTAGVKSGTLTLEYLDDYASASVDAVLWPLLGTVVTFKVRPDAGAVSATNPSYFGSVLISQTNLGGAHGDLAMKSVTFPLSGTITRSTTQ